MDSRGRESLVWRVASAAARNRRRTFLIVGLLLLVAGGLSQWVNQNLSSNLSDYSDPGSESARGYDRIQEATGINLQQGFVVLVRTEEPLSVGEPAPPRVAAVERILRDLDGVRRVETYASTGNPAMIARDRRSTYVTAYTGDVDEREATADLRDAIEAAPGDLDRHVALGGATAGNVEIAEVSTRDLVIAESIAFPILLALLLVVFRGVVAALLPLLIGTVTVMLAMLLLAPFVAALQISVFAMNLLFALGLGLSIDFSLLIVSRYREELARHGPGLGALRETYVHAGRAVAFSALTIGAALAGLLIFPLPYLYSMALAGVVVAAAAAFASLVVLPAVLLGLGERVNALAPERWRRRTRGPEESRFWYRLSHFVMRRPIPVATLAIAIVVVLALPAFGVRFVGVDAYMLPASTEAREVADALVEEFPGAQALPAHVVVRAGERERGEVVERARAIAGAADVEVGAPRFVGDSTWLVDAYPGSEPLEAPARERVQAMRSAVAYDETVLITGPTANYVDMRDSLADGLPLAVALVVLATMAALFALTGSVVLPIKALLMNALSLAAAFGVLVWVFQEGNLEGLLDFSSPGAIETSTPLLIFALVFGLSTDYEVFLLSRIKEAHDRGLPNRESVALGLQRTGRIVTAAAALFCVAVGALVLSRIVFVKELGFGTAFAVLLDATLIRALLVPSLMAMLGEWNWWAPAPLRRLHERFGFREGEAAAAPAVAPRERELVAEESGRGG